MRYLLSILTILAIIGTVWYNNHLTAQHEQNVNELNSQLEKLQLTTEPKINNLERKLKETYDTLDLEEETFRNKRDALETILKQTQAQQERTAQQNAERALRRKKAAVETALANRELTAKEWEVTLATFKTRRAEIAKLLDKNKQQITLNNQKLADIIKRDTEDIARREDAMKSAARASMASGRAGGRGTSYAIIEAKENMEKKHKDMTKAVALQNRTLMESIDTMEKELVQMDRAEEKFMQSNSPHNKPVTHLEHSEEFVAKVPVEEKAHQDILKLHEEYKLSVKKLQNTINNFQETKKSLETRLSDGRRDINKQKMDNADKHQQRLRNAQFTGYAIIGILAVLTLISFSITNRYA